MSSVLKKGRVQTDSDFVNTDLTAQRREYFFEMPFVRRILTPFLRNPKDIVLVLTYSNVLLFLLPVSALVFWICSTRALGPYTHLVKYFYWCYYLIPFGEPYILAMHYSSHRPIFGAPLTWLNSVVHNFLGPFFGIPGCLYTLHHVVMHHTENNHGLDLSSTEPYQRDSVLGLLCYVLRFVLLTPIELFLYAIKTKRSDWIWTFVLGVGTYVAFVIVLSCHVSFEATLAVFLGPYLVTMTALAVGNFSQHIFIDPRR